MAVSRPRPPAGIGIIGCGRAVETFICQPSPAVLWQFPNAAGTAEAAASATTRRLVSPLTA